MRLSLALGISSAHSAGITQVVLLSSSSVDEDASPTDVVGALSATFGTGPHTYSIVLDADSKFAISGSNLVIRTGASLNYATTTSHLVTVRATDSLAVTEDREFTISVNQVAPSIVTPLSDLTANVGAGPWVIDYSSAYAGSLRTVSLFDIPEDSGITIDTVAETITVPDAQILGSVTVQITNGAGTVFDEFQVDTSVANTAPEVVLNTIAMTVPAGTDGIPENTVAPALSGTPTEGETLTTTNGTWTGDATITYAYQWQRSDDGSTGWADISGATSSTYDLVAADATKYVRSEVTATNGVGSTVEVSSASAQIAAASASAPSRVTYNTYSNSTDGSGERDTSGSTITVGSQSSKIVTCHFSLGKNISGDSFAFTALVLTNGTDELAPDATTIATNTNNRRCAAAAYWLDVPAGTWWIKFTPSVSLRYASHYLALYQDRTAETPIINSSASGATGTSVNISVATTADNMMVTGMAMKDGGTTTPVVDSGDMAQVDVIAGGSAIGDAGSILADAVKATTGTSTTTFTFASAHNAIAWIAF